MNGSDVVQDIFVYIWKRRDLSFKKLIDIKAYVYTSIKNRFRDYLSHLKSGDRYCQTLLTDDDYFVAQIVESETFSLICNMNKFLPSECADIMKLYLEGWEIKDIAQKLNRPLSSVYAKKKEALEILKKSIPHLYVF